MANLFIDAGVLLIVTAIELNQEDLDVLKTVVGEDKIQVVWVGDKVTTDISYDIHVKSRDEINEGVVKIKHLLQDRGIVFKP